MKLKFRAIFIGHCHSELGYGRTGTADWRCYDTPRRHWFFIPDSKKMEYPYRVLRQHLYLPKH